MYGILSLTECVLTCCHGQICISHYQRLPLSASSPEMEVKMVSMYCFMGNLLVQAGSMTDLNWNRPSLGPTSRHKQITYITVSTVVKHVATCRE